MEKYTPEGFCTGIQKAFSSDPESIVSRTSGENTPSEYRFHQRTWGNQAGWKPFSKKLAFPWDVTIPIRYFPDVVGNWGNPIPERPRSLAECYSNHGGGWDSNMKGQVPSLKIILEKL